MTLPDWLDFAILATVVAHFLATERRLARIEGRLAEQNRRGCP